jgi:hypothetical protein
MVYPKTPVFIGESMIPERPLRRGLRICLFSSCLPAVFLLSSLLLTTGCSSPNHRLEGPIGDTFEGLGIPKPPVKNAAHSSVKLPNRATGHSAARRQKPSLAKEDIHLHFKPGFYSMFDHESDELDNFLRKAGISISLSRDDGISVGSDCNLTIEELRERLKSTSRKRLAVITEGKVYFEQRSELYRKVKDALEDTGFRLIAVLQARGGGTFLEDWIDNTKSSAPKQTRRPSTGGHS